MTMNHRPAHAMSWLLVLALVGASACGGLFRAGPTLPPLISARDLSVRLVAGDAADAPEKARLPTPRDPLARAPPAAGATATQARGPRSPRHERATGVEAA